MKALISLAIAVAVIPTAAQAAVSAGADTRPAAPQALGAAAAISPDALAAQHQRALRQRVVQLGQRARSQARRLGLYPPAIPRPAADPAQLARQERGLAEVVNFLSGRRRMIRADQRLAPPPGPRAGATIESRLAHAHRRASRLALALGLRPPATLTLAATREGRADQLSRWRTVAQWLSARSETRARSIPHRDALVCIARHESGGRWGISTGNGYYGGLQMDRSFQQAYAPRLYRTKGTADRWTPEEQMQAAEQAIRSRGFSPWPNTARMCGLL